MNESTPKTLQVSLLELPAFIERLIRVLSRGEAADTRARTILTAAVQVRCVECQIHISTDELLSLANHAPMPGPGSGKLARLHQGYCARNGCRSYYYEVIQLPFEGLVWEEVMASAAASNEEEPAPASPEEEAAALRSRREWRRNALRIVGIVLVVFALLLVRQWRIGGRIPLVREPEKYDCAATSVNGKGTCPDPNCPVCARRSKGTNTHATSGPALGPPLEIVLPEEGRARP